MRQEELSVIRHEAEQTKPPDNAFLLANIIEQFTIVPVEVHSAQKGT
jgi:hypothetical protein